MCTLNCSINRFNFFPLFSQKTINIVKHTVTACSSFLITCTIFIYLYNKSYLTIQFLFYEWQSLRFVQLPYFGDNCLILLPTFLLNKNIYIIYTPYIIFFFIFNLTLYVNYDLLQKTKYCYINKILNRRHLLRFLFIYYKYKTYNRDQTNLAGFFLLVI